MKSFLKNCLLLLLLAGSARAQSLVPRDELLSINKRYSDVKGFTMNIAVEIYATSLDNDPQQKYKGEIKKSGEYYYSDLLGEVSVVNEKSQIVIDKMNKIIYYDGKKVKSDSKTASYDFTTMLDSVMLPDNKIQFVSYGDENVLEVVPASSAFYSRLLISYIPSSHEITDITYFFPEDEEGNPGKVKIIYSQISLGVIPDASSFSETNFIVKKNNSIQPSSAYAGYVVIDISEPVVFPDDNN